MKLVFHRQMPTAWLALLSLLAHAPSTVVAISSVFLQPQHDIVAVVCDFNGAQNTYWINQAMRVEKVGHGSPRSISESRPWLQWIVDNYDVLPNRVFFSHGHRTAWHCNHNIHAITSLHAPFTGLAFCHWVDDVLTDPRWVMAGELPLLNGLHLAIFGKSWNDWFHTHDFASRPCCAENVVTSTAIRRLDRSVYQELISAIDTQPYAPWAWVYERTWQSLFTDAVRPSAEIVQSLQAFRLHQLVHVNPQWNATTNYTFADAKRYKCNGNWGH